MSSTVLFVYGSLRRGRENHRLMAGQEYLGPARTLPLYRLLHLGAYPGLVPDAGRGVAVEGELWRVDARTLAALDEFEGEHVFRRTRISVEGVGGPVEAYLYIEPAPDAPDCGVSWPPP
jgi:gamma-glutamylcyclotransferase (GGCT)/AIG2-like uncharacterized protein YtfP